MLPNQYFPLPIRHIEDDVDNSIHSLSSWGFTDAELKVADICHFEVKSGDDIYWLYDGDDPSSTNGSVLTADDLIGFILQSHSALRKLRWTSEGTTRIVVHLSRSN